MQKICRVTYYHSRESNLQNNMDAMTVFKLKKEKLKLCMFGH